MNDEIKALREEVKALLEETAKLRERVAVLEQITVPIRRFGQPMAPSCPDPLDITAPWLPPYVVTC